MAWLAPGGRAVTVAVLPSADEDESRMPLKTVTTFVGWFSCIIVIRWMDQFVLGSKETEIELLLFLVIKSKLQKKRKG